MNPLGTVNLENCEGVLEETSSKKPCFMLVTQARTYKIVASTRHEMAEWIVSLKSVSQHLNSGSKARSINGLLFFLFFFKKNNRQTSKTFFKLNIFFFFFSFLFFSKGSLFMKLEDKERLRLLDENKEKEEPKDSKEVGKKNGKDEIKKNGSQEVSEEEVFHFLFSKITIFHMI